MTTRSAGRSVLHTVMFLMGLAASDSQLATGAYAASIPGPVTVLDRTRLGTYIEETAYVTSGPLAGQIAMLSGNEIYGVPLNPRNSSDLRKLFDIRNIGIGVTPKGMAFVQSEGVFAYISGAEPDVIHITDIHGVRLPARKIGYANQAELSRRPHPEGILYLPPSSPWFPDHLVVVMNLYIPNPPYVESSLRVLARDGSLTEEIRLPKSLRDRYLTAVTVTTGGELLIGVDNEIWRLGWDGATHGGPVTVLPAGAFVEGLEQLPNGSIVFTAAAKLYFVDQNLAPTGQFDAGLGLHLIGQGGIAWNSDTGEHLITTNFEASGDYFTVTQLGSIARTGNSFTPAFPIVAGTETQRVSAIDYIPVERLIVSRGSGVKEIALFSMDGRLVQRIDVSAFGFPRRIKFIPELQQFAVVFLDLDTGLPSNQITFLTRAGGLVRQLDLGPAGITSISGLAFFNPLHPSGGEFVVFNNGEVGHRAIVTDFSGTVRKEFDFLEQLGVLNVVDAAPITSGPQKGSFSVLDTQNQYELTVFKLN